MSLHTGRSKVCIQLYFEDTYKAKLIFFLMARGVKYNIFEKSIFCEFSEVTHVYITANLNIFLFQKIELTLYISSK
jgi:hypothetical protein